MESLSAATPLLLMSEFVENGTGNAFTGGFRAVFLTGALRYLIEILTRLANIFPGGRCLR